MYDGLNVGKRNLTLNLKQPEAVALVEAPRRRVGRRGRRELRTARDEGLRPRLRHARPDHTRSRDDQHVPERPDRSAQGLPRFRRARLGARGLQRAHRLARPRAGRPVRHDHRLARAPVRRRRARGRVALSPPHRPRRVPRSVPGGVARAGRSRRGCSTTRSTACFAAATATTIATRSCTARSRAATKTASTTVGSRSRAGPTTSSPACTQIAGHDVEAWTRARVRASKSRSSCRPRGSKRSRYKTSATSTPIRSSPTAGTSCRLRIRSSATDLYERNGFRLAACSSGYDGARPDARRRTTNGRLREMLGLSENRIEALRGSGAVE